MSKIIPTLEDMGRHHADYGARDVFYGIVAEALLWTLRQEPDEAFSKEVKAAWIENYMTLANVMIEATEKTA